MEQSRKKVREVTGGDQNAKQITIGQIKKIEENIKAGKVNGEAMNEL